MTYERLDKMKELHSQSLNLFKKKNADYNNTFEKYGILGVLIRISDKVDRIKSITSRNVIMVNDESLRDSLVDLNNYSSIGLMLLDIFEKKI